MNQKKNNYNFFKEIILVFILKLIPTFLFIFATLPIRTFENKKLMFAVLLLHFIVFYTMVIYLKVVKLNWFFLIVVFMTFFLDNIHIKQIFNLLILCFIVICLIFGIKNTIQKGRIVGYIKEHKRIIGIHLLLLVILIPLLIIINANYILILLLFFSLIISALKKEILLLKYIYHINWFIIIIFASMSIIDYVYGTLIM